MHFDTLELPGLILFSPKVHSDDRGYFFESFHSKGFQDVVGEKISFVQDNLSHSVKGALRGLHYQLWPEAQGKLVQVVEGEVFDVAVDIRKNSMSFGKWVGVLLSATNKKQLWIPPGFAHGFLTLTSTATMYYKTTSYYAKNLERIILWNDEKIGIKWPSCESVKISAKDSVGSSLLTAETL